MIQNLKVDFCIIVVSGGTHTNTHLLAENQIVEKGVHALATAHLTIQADAFAAA